jgi:acetyl-CoA decarbonylase/synthase complex subunit delta
MIDVNLCKQLNILLTTMGLPQNRIVNDPLTSPLGYGLEYTYSVMERIRLTGIGGDNMIVSPMILQIGVECSKLKEYKAPEETFPDWGDLKKRATYWEVATATSLLYTGADIMIMYMPEAVAALKKTINSLMDKGGI